LEGPGTRGVVTFPDLSWALSHTQVGVLLLTTTTKEGALVGGPAFMKAVGNDIVEGIVTENIPVFTEEEKYNEAILRCVFAWLPRLTSTDRALCGYDEQRSSKQSGDAATHDTERAN